MPGDAPALIPRDEPEDQTLNPWTDEEKAFFCGRHPLANGVIGVSEGANMPTTLEGIKAFQEKKILFGKNGTLRKIHTQT